MPESTTFNYLAILAATVSSFLLGGVWFSSALFGDVWKKEVGLGGECDKNNHALAARLFGTTFLLELVMAFNLAAFIGPKTSLGFGAFAGAAAGFGWVGLSFGVSYLFERRSLRLFLINAGYHGFALTLMGAILGAWQ